MIFHFDPNNVASSYSIGHVFAGHPDDGDNPRHDAMTPFNGQLYGTTLEGGTNNTGIIFSIGQDGTGYQELFSLAKPTGDQSHSCFVVADNILYGMTADGGDSGEGVIFAFDPFMSNFQTLYSFMCGSLGKEPHGRLTLDPNGTTLYGMTRKGGNHDFGVLFSIDTNGTNYTELHDFAGGGSDGATSDHGYVVQSGHHLYGMTTNGGHHNDGVIFKLNIDDQSFQLLHKFGETHHDHKNPYGSLLLVNDKLYGTTANGGDNDMGTVFVINLDGNNYQRLYSVGGQTNDGVKPIDNVILVNGWLYGMTTEGGAYGQGTIFKVSPTPSRSPTPAPRPTPPHKLPVPLNKERHDLKRVTGIGGIFFKAHDPDKLRNWHRLHLGIECEKDNGAIFKWRTADDPNSERYTVWAPFSADTDYFAPSTKPFMINLQVENLDEVLAQLKFEGVDVDPKVESYDYGKFGWIMDPEGNRVELWEPPSS